MRADRLISIVLLLQARGRMTSRELARRLEVSERTIHRDMEALSMAGLPVYAERGTHGGWYLRDGYRSSLANLNDAEIQALVLAGPPRLLTDLGLRGAGEAALLKLVAALPSLSRHEAERVRRYIHIDPSSWQPWEEDLSSLPALQQAIWHGRKLRFTYSSSEGRGVERTVEPMGLVYKGTVWYLVAMVDGDARTYRVSRVREARVLEEFTPPDTFDLEDYWQRSTERFKATLPRYPVTVRSTPEALSWLRRARYARIEQELRGPDGWTTLHVQFETEDEAQVQLLGLGPEVEVLEPPELRERIGRLARQVSALYAGER